MVAALYRRYRPESFSEMIGQSQVTEPLMTALRNGRVGHAYLFSGPRGCGKTTSARILARCLNCVEGPTDTPCNVCPSCIELSRDGGGSLDVVEIDAASHGGVDDARDLRERAVFAPARDRFKIFIIDEAHMVTSAGFNALLKIVEEPPPHVKFVFATTEPEKVIGTIRSRTHHYPFRLIAPGTLIDYVQSLSDSEGVQVEPGVLPLVVRAGGGSVRDTLSILDQLIAGSEGTLVTADRAAGLLGFTGSELLDEVVAAFGTHDAAAAFRATDRVVQTGQDPRRFVEDLLERLRDLIVVSATTVEGAAAVFRGVPQDQLSRMFDQAQQFGAGELSRVADVASETLDRMVGATAPKLQLELMIARALVALDELRARLGAGGGAGQMPAPAQTGAPRQQMPQASQTPQRQQSQQSGQTRQGQQAGQPQQGQPAAVDPISALAAARNAVTQVPAAQAPTAQAPGTQASAAPTSASQAPMTQPQTPQTQAPQSPAQVEPAAQAQAPEQTQPSTVPQGSTPNAAQTAASVRDFLRGDTAGAQQQTAQSQQQQQQQSVQSGSAAVDQDGSAPHPNEGAAGFGRPISDILSAAQIASIGTEPTKPAPAPAAPTTPAPAAGTAPAAGAPATAAPTPGQQQAPVAGQPAPAPHQPVPGQPAGAPPAGDGAALGSDLPPATGHHDTSGSNADTSPDANPGANPDEELAGGFSDLLEVWPDLLEEILEQDRDAWNAVKSVQPLSLEGDVLTVGLASQSDLAAFKTQGSGPLREAILSAVGITVRYVPRQIQPGSSPANSGQRSSEPTDPAAEEPHRAGPTSQAQQTPSNTQAPVAAQHPAPASGTSPDRNASPGSNALPGGAPSASSIDPVERAAARLSALGPALAAPAWADPVPPAAPAAQPSVAAPSTAAPNKASPSTAEPNAAAPSAHVPATNAPTSNAPTVQPGADVAPTPEPSQPSQTPGAPQASAEAPSAAASYADDPYANDPYAGEPSDDTDGDPYASAAPAQTPAPAPAPTPAQPRVAADPAPQREPQQGTPQQEGPQQKAPQQKAPQQEAPQQQTAPEPTQAPTAASAAPAPSAPSTASPRFTRYGEAIVRETLGARFVEELPIAPATPQN